MRIESRPWAYQRVNQDRTSPLTFPKWVQMTDTQICRFSQKFRAKPLKVCYKVTLSKNFQRQICSAFNYLSNDINSLTGDNHARFHKIWA